MSDRLGAVGEVFPVQTGPWVEENTRTGFESRYKFKGSYNECFNERLSLRASGLYSSITFGPAGDGEYELMATRPTDEFGQTPGPLPSINELEVEVAQIDLAFSLKLNTVLNTQCIASVILISDDFKSGRGYAKYDSVSGHMTDSGWADALAAVATAANAAGANVAKAQALFINIVGRGLAAALEYHTVYRRTLTAATPQQVTASYVGAGQIWTDAEVSSYEQISPTDWFQLPSPAQFLKSKPQVIATARQKTQVIYSYTEIKQATALLYDAYGSAVLLDT